MKTIQFKIPDSVELDGLEAKLLCASRLYEKGKLTLQQAADMAGMSKDAFMEILRVYGVSLINHPSSELRNDIENARKYSG